MDELWKDSHFDMTGLNPRWTESIGRDDPSPAYIEITLSSGRKIIICEDDLMRVMESGRIEAESLLVNDHVEKHVVNLRDKLSAADIRFLKRAGIAYER